MPASADTRQNTPSLTPAAADARLIASMLNIAGCALAADDAARHRKAHDEALNAAYAFYKQTHGIDRVERGSVAWDMMMLDTQSEYQDAQKARRAEYNARRRLATAIRNYRNS